VQVVAVEPATSPVITQKRAGKPLQPGQHKIQGIGAGFVPEILETTINDMCKSSASIMEKMITVIQYRDLTRALEIEQDDDEMDRLHRELIATLLGDNWTHGIETAIDMTLLGRYYERFADHAVSISHRVYFLVTGEYAVPRV
jgi:phosphate transport system protein